MKEHIWNHQADIQHADLSHTTAPKNICLYTGSNAGSKPEYPPKASHVARWHRGGGAPQLDKNWPKFRYLWLEDMQIPLPFNASTEKYIWQTNDDPNFMTYLHIIRNFPYHLYLLIFKAWNQRIFALPLLNRGAWTKVARWQGMAGSTSGHLFNNF